MTAYLFQLVSPFKHAERRAPSCISVDGNLEGVENVALDLYFVEVFDSLSRRLDLQYSIDET